jgi:hypothetical protein
MKRQNSNLINRMIIIIDILFTHLIKIVSNFKKD